MPEGPEVLCQSLQLSTFLKGKRLIQIKVNSLSRYFSRENEMNLFKKLNLELSFLPFTFEEVAYKNKKIVFCLKNGEKQIFLVSFLGMSGKWVTSPLNHSGLVFELEGESLYFDDPRHFGSLKMYYSVSELFNVFKKFGKDFLTEEVTLEEFEEKIKNKKIEKLPISEFLISQKYFSGVGNYIRSDCLYLARIHPLKKLGELLSSEIERLLKSIYSILEESVECKGYSLRDYASIENEKGSYTPLVYNRKKDKDGNEIVKMKIKGRSVYFVPCLQKL